MNTLFKVFFGCLLGVALLPYLLMRNPTMPAGTDLASVHYPVSAADLLIDRTWLDTDSGERMRSHVIFDRLLTEIEAADDYLIIDFFLWNPWRGNLGDKVELRSLSTQLAAALLRKRARQPEVPILVITDPINAGYGRHAPPYFAELRAAGVLVVFTDLDQLPDSNRVLAPQLRFWRQYLSLPQAAVLPNLFDAEGESFTAQEFGRLLLLKANHRKVLVSGKKNQPSTLVVGSLNPADGSANHSNLAIAVSGPVADFAARSELEIARWSAPNDVNLYQLSDQIEARLSDVGLVPEVSAGKMSVAWRSEGAIHRELVERLDRVGAGARVDVAVFYLSDRAVVGALRRAAERGAVLRILLDANKDAFGREKNGIPNRPVAAELMAVEAQELDLRWAVTHGEQFHCKALRIRSADTDLLFLGSANWTRRNLDNNNLEANLLLLNAQDAGIEFDRYFESVWTNGLARESLDYDAYVDESRLNKWLYRGMEWSGLCAF